MWQCDSQQVTARAALPHSPLPVHSFSVNSLTSLVILRSVVSSSRSQSTSTPC